jgi:hypothetical protein
MWVEDSLEQVWKQNAEEYPVRTYSHTEAA